jgi:hypothetical protein
LQGVLAQARNGEELFWEEKFHAANGKAQACTQGALLFFLLSLGGGAGKDFFSPLVSNVFPLCSLQIPNMFPQVPNVFPNMFVVATHFYPICFGKCCPPFTYIGAPKGRISMGKDLHTSK